MKVATIQTGGKQYVVSDGSVIVVEKLDAEKGKVIFDKVLLVDDGAKITIGAPYVSGAKVTGEVIEEGRKDKVTVIHYRAKSRYFKKRGHRQHYTKVKITALP